ncbi:uncharacterized protein LOC105735712 isoform X1 [Apis florea]|uniref:uncharacterized protein LOC105735712 isoform X1 n=1 Tax=Apis florea TaxID=7463 RepID=UPI0012FEB652|nr:uncharacterized protein LOC105735712 isoform X1 [Apis florea]
MKSNSRRSRHRIVWNKSFLKFESKELRKFEGCTQGSNFSTLSDHVRLLLLVELGKRDLVMFTVRKRSVKSPVQSVKETELKTFPSKPILSRDPVTRRQAHLSRVHSILFSKSDVRYQRSKKSKITTQKG